MKSVALRLGRLFELRGPVFCGTLFLSMARLPISGVLIADNRAYRSDADVWRPDEGGATAGAWTDVASSLVSCFDEVILVAEDPTDYLTFDALIVSDHDRPAGLLSGIQAGLFAARNPHAFVTAVGLGVLPVAVIDRFAAALAPRWDAVLMERDGGVSPLPGVYHKRVLKPLARELMSTGGRFDRLIPRLRLGKVRID